MSPRTTGWDELHLAENPAVELLKSLDYTYLPPEALEGERKSFKETILTLRLAKILKQLNPWLSETNVAKAVKTVTHVAAASLAEANEKVYTSLTYGIALEQDRGDGRKSHTVRFFDFDRPDRNEWIVTRQYKVLGSKKHIVPGCRGVRQRPPARRHRMQEPDHWRCLEGEGDPAAPPVPGGWHAVEGPGGTEALRGGADSRRNLWRTGRRCFRNQVLVAAA